MKRILGLFITSLSCLTLFNCSLSSNDANDFYNGKTIEDYDVTENCEYEAYIETPFVLGDVKIEASNYVRGLFSISEGFTIGVTPLNDTIKSFDIIDVYATSLDGENRANFVNGSITMKFDEQNKSILNFDFINKDDVHVNYRREYRVIVRGYNITFHTWEAPKGYCYNGETKENYDVSTNTIRYYSMDECSKRLPDEYNGRIKLLRFDGVWAKDYIKLDIYSTQALFILVDAYVIDRNDDNKYTILNSPIEIDSYNDCYVDFHGPGKEYYERCGGRYKIVFVTNTGYNYEFISWETEISEKELSDYNVSNNINSSYFYYDTIKINSFYVEVCNLQKITDVIRIDFKTTDYIEKYDVVDIYWSYSDGTNIRHLLDKPISLWFASDSIRTLELNNISDFNSYYENSSKDIELHIITENNNLTIYYSENNENVINRREIECTINDSPFFEGSTNSRSYEGSFNKSDCVRFIGNIVDGKVESISICIKYGSRSYDSAVKIDKIYITDLENENRKDLISEPIYVSNGFNKPYFLVALGNAIESGNKVRIHIDTVIGKAYADIQL